MSVGTVRFYRLRGSLSSGEYPLFTAVPSSSPVATFPDVLYRGGLQASVDLPYFSGMEEVNVASIGADYYWVTEYRERTADAKQYTFTLDYMAPTSLLRSGHSITGTFHKTPVNLCPYLKQEITNGLKLIDSSYEPSALEMGTVYEHNGVVDNGYWLQISGFKKSGGTNPITSLTTYGMFIGIDTRDATPSKNPVVATYYSDTNIGYYPTWAEIVNDITECTGIQADQVVDCSISKRCPFQFGKTLRMINGATHYEPYLIGADGRHIFPSLINTLYAFNLEGIYNLYGTKLLDNTETVTIATADPFVRQCGYITIRDWNQNNVMEIPIDGSSMSIVFRCHSDKSGIYTIVSHADQQICIPEGKMPYIENAWETYKAYQMNGDRQAMENAIRQADMERQTRDVVGVMNSTINAVSTGVMTGVIAGNVPGAVVGAASGLLGSGISLWESERSRELTRIQAQNDLELSKRRAIDQPQTSYNTAYGLIYCALNEMNDLRACVVLPHDVGRSYYNSWCEEYGYPSEGVQTFTVSPGFYQGKILANDDMSGMRFDRLNEVMMNGFKFVRS